MKDKIIKISDMISNLIEPYWNKVMGFLSKEYYIVYAAIAALVVILLLAGLFTMLKKAPRFLFLIVFLLGIVVALWSLVVKK